MSETTHTTAPLAPSPSRAVVVVAAGSGTRLGLGTAKALVPVAGVLMLERALEPIFSLPEPTFVAVVAPPDRVDDVQSLVARVAGPAAGYTAVVPGGADRHGSVQAGLAVLPSSVETVLVHDAARCLTPVAQFASVFEAVERDRSGVVPALPVTDTVKRVAEGVVLETVDRSALVGVQTPQGFPLQALRAAYARAERAETDDAGVFQAAGGTVRFVPGDADALKITTAWDLRRAESIVRERANRPLPLVGLGIDVHAFDPQQPCHVGMLEFDGEPGLAGHSDGDAVSHAIVDAILSAAGLGDIGGLFGTADPRYADASGAVFLAGARERIEAHGLRIGRVTVQIIGNRPRVGRRRSEMEHALSGAVGAPVSVSATTTDGLGFTGRGEGLAAIATAVLHTA